MTRPSPRLMTTICKPHIVRGAIQVSLVVGTALNLLNQGASWHRGDGISVFQLVVNYAVPYLVASYSAARNENLRTTQSDDSQAAKRPPREPL